MGAAQPYGSAGPWLSGACLQALETLAAPHFPEGTSPGRCVFAAMDYHLDWLHAALTLARTQPTWDGTSKSEPEIRAPKPDQPLETLRCLPVQGTQEDVDLLVVFQNEHGVMLLFVEAKATPRFDPVQLGRKLLRLDAILEEARFDAVRGRWSWPPPSGRSWTKTKKVFCGAPT